MNGDPLQQQPLERQSPGTDPRSKRNSGLFAFLKWFKPSGSRESIENISSSCESLSSTHSTGTVASFSFVLPSAYQKVSEKSIQPGPETDTYRARLKQRDRRRENDKNLTLRKKYNLFFNRDSLWRSGKKEEEEEDSTKSLPLMTKATSSGDELEKMHRRTNSESSKTKKAGAYLHVKGKRKAPQPPGLQQGNSTMSLRRKKRVAPAPPNVPNGAYEEPQPNEAKPPQAPDQTHDLSNDSLRLDQGFLKPTKDQQASPRASVVLPAPVSPKPWYKRNKKTAEPKYEPIEKPLTEVQFMRNSTVDLAIEEVLQITKKDENKRKSGMSFLTNISELDREASEILASKHSSAPEVTQEMPHFMRPKDQDPATDTWSSPKRRSAKDLIAKFNAITKINFKEKKQNKQELMLESHKKRLEAIQKNPIMKSESASAIKTTKETTPKLERKNWKCPKCSLENEYWRIICHVCSAIKPYFDDFSASPQLKKAEDELQPVMHKSSIFIPPENLERSKTQIGFSALASYNFKNKKSISLEERGANKDKPAENKAEERERLKKMLIEMKNSLPKRQSNMLMKQNSRASIIVENDEAEHGASAEEVKKNQVRKDEVRKDEAKKNEVKDEEKKAEVFVVTTETVYENIKVKKTDSPKPIKVSASAQTNPVFKKAAETSTSELASILTKPQIASVLIKPEAAKLASDPPTKPEAAKEPADAPPKPQSNGIKSSELMGAKPKTRAEDRENFELMRPKDFETIYSGGDSNSPARVYANLARNDELSVFFNMPKRVGELKHKNHKDTIEINRLLRRLESSIAKGELVEASIYAKELAQMKINCSVVRQKSQSPTKKQGFTIEMYVEDKVSHRGPFPLEVIENQTVAQLKHQVEKEFEIPANVQRWILGKKLATDDKATLKDHAVTSDRCPVFLYLVAPVLDNTKLDLAQKEPTNQKPTAPPETTSDFKSKIIADFRKNSLKKTDPPKIVEVIPKEIPQLQAAVVTKAVVVEPVFNVEAIPEIGAQLEGVKTEVRAQPEAVKSEAVAAQPKASGVQLDAIKAAPRLLENQSRGAQVSLQPEVSTGAAKAQLEPLRTQPEAFKTTLEIGTQLAAPKTQPEPVEGVVVQPEPVKEGAAAQAKPVRVAAAQPEARRAQPEPVLKLRPEPFKLPTQAPAHDDAFDDRTLRPQKEWECHLCTLLNPIASNICAVCATVRRKEPRRTSLKKTRAPQPVAKKDETYRQLMNLDNADLVGNAEDFECLVCFLDVAAGEGVTLRECLHQFCRPCLANTIEYNEDAEVKCPFRDDQYSCNIALQDREIKALVRPQVYEQHLAKSVAEAENKIGGKAFHCKTPDCKGWCIFEDNVNEFRCPVCRRINCLTCQAIHSGMNCKQYQEKTDADESGVEGDARRTKDMLEEMVRKGEALTCPTCQVILMKKWGCDWVRCSMCKTEICWVTRGPRWGPQGKGDTSGGCQCGVNGVKCHPQCSYCH